MNIDSIITEWTYRLEKGYPDCPEDYIELRNVLHEQTDLPIEEQDAIVRRAMGLTEDDEEIENSKIRFDNLGFSPNVIQQVQSVYNTLNDDAKTLFDKNFRKHTIQSFVSDGYKYFKDFFNISDRSTSRADIGFGEVSIILATSGTNSQGTTSYDIQLDNQKPYEVKQLSAGEFLTGKQGTVYNSDYVFTKKIQEFYSKIIDPFSNIGDATYELTNLVGESSKKIIPKIVNTLEIGFQDPVDTNQIYSFNSIGQTVFDGWYNSFKLLHSYIYETEVDTSFTDSRIIVKQRDKESAYWISDDDIENIQQNSGTPDETNINIGRFIDNENKNVVIWFKRLESHPYVVNPNNFIQDLNNIKFKIFEPVSGVIYFINNTPYIGHSNNFAIGRVGQTRFILKLKQHSSSGKYKYQQAQD